MIIKNKLFGRMLVKNEQGKWFGYGIDSDNNVIGCVEITPPECKTLYDVYEFVKNRISQSTVIESSSTN